MKKMMCGVVGMGRNLNNLMRLTFGAILALFLGGTTTVHAALVSLTTATTNENFGVMAAGATAALPTGFIMGPAGHGAATYYLTTNFTAVSAQASSGAPTAGGRYNWGSSAAERAAGFMTSGGYASPNSLMYGFVNNNSLTITNVILAFDYERYRQNTAAASITFFH